MMGYIADLILLASLMGIVHSAPGCEFPSEWKGWWFESLIGEVEIRDNEITKKGTCVERQSNYYLLERKDIGCYLCILVRVQHVNVLQYQESFCVGKDTLHRICEQIQLATLVHTLIREPSIPSPCPFQDAFHFTYNNNTGGWCRDPTSYAKPCASDATFRFHFKHCPSAAYTYHRDADLTCIGTWLDKPDMYLVARLTAPDLTQKQLQYRCFIYRPLGTLMHMAMSSDASCRGLQSYNNGPFIMELTKDVFGWPETECTFPHWLRKTTWRDLSGRHLYRVNEGGNVMKVLVNHTYDMAPEVARAFRCYRMLYENTTDNSFVISSFTSHGCTSKYQCLKFDKRKDGVIQIYEGRYMDYGSGPCWLDHLNNASKSLLIPEDIATRSCPMPGRYFIHTGSMVCKNHFRIGCNGSSILDIVSSCSSRPSLMLECMKTWREGKTKYLIARKVSDPKGVLNCFSFTRSGPTMLFTINGECNTGTPYILRDAVTYVLDDEAKSCAMPEKDFRPKPLPEEPPDKIQPQKDEPSHGGSYQHIEEPRKSREERTKQNKYAKGIAISLIPQTYWIYTLYIIVIIRTFVW